MTFGVNSRCFRRRERLPASKKGCPFEQAGLGDGPDDPPHLRVEVDPRRLHVLIDAGAVLRSGAATQKCRLDFERFMAAFDGWISPTVNPIPRLRI